jgi:hypothetical protein
MKIYSSDSVRDVWCIYSVEHDIKQFGQFAFHSHIPFDQLGITTQIIRAHSWHFLLHEKDKALLQHTVKTYYNIFQDKLLRVIRDVI